MNLSTFGDKGQSYEVSFYDAAKKERRVLGWAASPAGAESLCNSVRIHPGWSDPEIKIREKEELPVHPVHPVHPVLSVQSVPEKPPSAKRSYE